MLTIRHYYLHTIQEFLSYSAKATYLGSRTTLPVHRHGRRVDYDETVCRLSTQTACLTYKAPSQDLGSFQSLLLMVPRSPSPRVKPPDREADHSIPSGAQSNKASVTVTNTFLARTTLPTFHPFTVIPCTITSLFVTNFKTPTVNLQGC